ncbi:alpha/beta hydrolase [Amycolatopsis endophytica]|uniref:Pimeloyl-ACP methyl ester carboxylesterase n=1 Tax=Amycolatopsis endophytica TaxID=860233 RepID=A0A853BEA2_9PSEU|nr:alpha/beta hydrolase [Amycolatopsis endophytica]NYI93105.1 pimeloyl-ACP methyl ester carboxylesterase [Amycolatopsis endophytica]
MRKPVLAVLAAALVASPVPAVAATADTLSWGKCPEDVVATGLRCATLDVPLDYRDPEGPAIEVAISRLPSAHPEKRRGVLLTNTGGPGGPGLRFPADLRDLGLPQSVLDSYDVIGMDPRGVGHSTPVTCDLTPGQAFTDIPLYARDSAEVAATAGTAAVIARQCGSSATAPLLPHITTANTARDMDRVREALGEPEISYLGISYGTYLGAVYTTLFPGHSDRFLLDSSVGPGGFDITASRMLGRGVEDRFPDFAEFAVAHPEYELGRTPGEVRAKYFDLAARLDTTPSPEGVDGKLFRHLTFAQLYYDKNLPSIAAQWHALNTGAPLPAAGTAAAAAAPTDNAAASQLHVVCNDSDWPEDVRTYQRNVAVDRIRHPMFGAAAANVWPCAFWPSEPVEPPVEITGRGPSNVLMVQNLRDPATPLAGALALRHAFGDRARMVTADQGGHLAYLFQDDTCLNDAATTFLATGQRPRHDTAC